MSRWQEHPWMGVFPATLCTFHEDETLDEASLRAYIRKLAGVPGLKGLVPNGHTGEIMSLRESERARVTKIVAEEVRRVERASRSSAACAAKAAFRPSITPWRPRRRAPTPSC